MTCPAFTAYVVTQGTVPSGLRRQARGPCITEFPGGFPEDLTGLWRFVGRATQDFTEYLLGQYGEVGMAELDRDRFPHVWETAP